jgi:hypothetical protein
VNAKRARKPSQKATEAAIVASKPKPVKEDEDDSCQFAAEGISY